MDVSSQLAPMDIHQVQSDIHAIDLDNIAYGLAAPHGTSSSAPSGLSGISRLRRSASS